MAITALAGPVSNFLLAYVALLARSLLIVWAVSGGPSQLIGVIDFLAMLAILSLGLGIFNLVPVPPLDGFKVLGAFLPDKIYYRILRYERFGMLALMLLLGTGVLDGPLVAARGWVLQLLLSGTSWPLKLLPAG